MLKLLLPALRVVCSLNIAGFWFFLSLSPRGQTTQGQAPLAAILPRVSAAGSPVQGSVPPGTPIMLILLQNQGCGAGIKPSEQEIQQGGATPHQGAPRAAGEAPRGGMGHELIQKKALKIIRKPSPSAHSCRCLASLVLFSTVETKKHREHQVVPLWWFFSSAQLRHRWPLQWREQSGGCSSSAAGWEKLAKGLRSDRTRGKTVMGIALPCPSFLPPPWAEAGGNGKCEW